MRTSEPQVVAHTLTAQPPFDIPIDLGDSIWTFSIEIWSRQGSHGFYLIRCKYRVELLDDDKFAPNCRDLSLQSEQWVSPLGP
ncbi:hypothetical protein J1614_011046 [Plenodomus biglobosus]|nr:hypothetical protein J1614_011046 [Plenodomus biglobosus]